MDWLCTFGTEVRRVLRETGSFVLDLGGAYRRGVPVRSLHQYRVLLKLCDKVGYHLAEEFVAGRRANWKSRIGRH